MVPEKMKSFNAKFKRMLCLVEHALVSHSEVCRNGVTVTYPRRRANYCELYPSCNPYGVRTRADKTDGFVSPRSIWSGLHSEVVQPTPLEQNRRFCKPEQSSCALFRLWLHSSYKTVGFVRTGLTNPTPCTA